MQKRAKIAYKGGANENNTKIGFVKKWISEK